MSRTKFLGGDQVLDPLRPSRIVAIDVPDESSLFTCKGMSRHGQAHVAAEHIAKLPKLIVGTLC